MAYSKASALPRRGERFGDVAELRAAVRRHCEAEWSAFAGRSWAPADAFAFDWMNERPDRLSDTDSLKADYLATVRELVGAGKRAREFVAALRRQGKPAGVLEWIAELLDGEEWRRMEYALPAVEERENSQRRQLHRWTGRYGLLALADLDAMPPLTPASTNRQLAIVSLLCGCFPDSVLSTEQKKGITVAEVIAAEQRAIGEARARYTGGGRGDSEPKRRQRRK